MTTMRIGLWLCCSPLLVTPAWAEDLFDLPLEALLQMTVTSTSYFEQTLLESASSVSYSDQARWDETGVRNVGELLNTLPSTVATAGYPKTRVVAIRGYYNFASDTGVATLLDDVPLNGLRFGTGTQSIDGYDLGSLHSLEVIRGPGSSLHGADAFHGVLAMKTVDHGDTGVVTRATLGTEEESAASLVSRFHDDRQHLTLALTYRNIGDQALEYPYEDPSTGAPLTGERRNGIENQNIVLKYRLQATDRAQLYATGYLMDMDADQLVGLGRTLGSDTMEDKDWSDYQSRLSLFKTGLDYQFSDRLSSSVFAYYWQSEDESVLDLREMAAPFNFYQQEDSKEHHWGLKALNRHTFGEHSNLAYGYAYHQAKVDEFTTARSVGSSPASVSHSPQEGAEEDYHSLFLDGRYGFHLLGDQLTTLVYGTRVDNYKHFDWQNSPRLGLIQTLSDDWVAKVLVSHSYRKPNTFERYGSNSADPNYDLDPETLDNLELVLQHPMAGGLASITLFKSQWQDAIRFVRYPVQVSQVQGRFENTGDNESQGVELEVLGEQGPWRWNANASYVRSEDLDLELVYEAFPDWMANLGVGYEWTRWDLYVMTRYEHRDAGSQPRYGNEPMHPPETLLRTDVTLAWALAPSVTTRLAVRNLFDRENSLPGYSDRLEGTPDNGINASLSIEWQPFK